MHNTLLEAGVFGLTTGMAANFGSQIWSNQLYRNYAIMVVVGVILLWIVLLNGHRKLL